MTVYPVTDAYILDLKLKYHEANKVWPTMLILGPHDLKYFFEHTDAFSPTIQRSEKMIKIQELEVISTTDVSEPRVAR